MDTNVEEEEEEENSESGIDEIRKRYWFFRKVFRHVVVQVFASLTIMAPMILHESIRMWASNLLISVVSIVLLVGVTSLLLFFHNLTQWYPWNYAILVALTVCTAFWLGCIGSKYNAASSITALGCTIILGIVVGVFADQTNKDFTVFIHILLAVTLAMVIFCILFFFFPSSEFRWFILISGELLSDVYFIVDLQMIYGDRKYALPPDAPVLGSTLIFMDFAYMLVYFVLLIGDHAKSHPQPL